MQSELVEELKKEYNKRIEEVKEHENKKKRLELLSNNEFVKEYLELSEILKKDNTAKGLSAKEQLHILFCHHYIKKIKSTNDIYVYLGTFKISDEMKIIGRDTYKYTSKDDPAACYSLYHNVESINTIKIAIEERESFEKEHIVIYPPTSYNGYNFFFEKIQREFVNDCVILGQEEAVKRVLTKGKIK